MGLKTAKITAYVQTERIRALHFIQRNSLGDISLDGVDLVHLGVEVTQIKQGSNVANSASSHKVDEDENIA